MRIRNRFEIFGSIGGKYDFKIEKAVDYRSS